MADAEGQVQPGIARRAAGATGRGIGWTFRFIMKVFLLALFVAVGLFIGGFFQFANTVTSYETNAEIKATQAIVALTGGSSRIATGLALVEDGKGERLLISGVHENTTKEALKHLNMDKQKVFDCCVDIERDALDTVGNAVETGKWMKRKGFTSLTLVTSDYHMPRSLLEFGRHLTDITVQPYPVRLASLNDGKWYLDGDTLRFMVSEYAKFVGALGRDYFSSGAFNVVRGSMFGD